MHAGVFSRRLQSVRLFSKGLATLAESERCRKLNPIRKTQRMLPILLAQDQKAYSIWKVEQPRSLNKINTELKV